MYELEDNEAVTGGNPEGFLFGYGREKKRRDGVKSHVKPWKGRRRARGVSSQPCSWPGTQTPRQSPQPSHHWPHGELPSPS